MRLTWLGAAGFKIETQAGAIILINPFLSRPKTATPSLYTEVSNLFPVDEILLSSGRFYHAMDTPAIVKQTGAIVHAPQQVCRHLARLDVSLNNLQVIVPHKTKTIARLSWQAWAVHRLDNHQEEPSTALDAGIAQLARQWPAQEMVHYTFQNEGLSVIYIGSTAWIDPEILNLQPDIALLPVNQKDIDKTIQLVTMLKPSVIIPHQWDNFYPPLTSSLDTGNLDQSIKTQLADATICWPSLGRPLKTNEL